LQQELAETNRGLLALNMELEDRVDARTAELRQLTLELEARVRERTAQLSEANANLQNFTHSAAHDLRSPLRAIKGFSNMLLEEYHPEPHSQGHALIARITQCATQMQQLLDDLLEYSKLAEKELKLEPVSLQSTVRDALALLDADIHAKNATITVDHSLPTILGHPATVVLLLNNFVSNALKFVSPGVQPHIRIWAEQRKDTAIGRGGDSETRSSVRPRRGRPGEPEASTRGTQRLSSLVRLWVEDNGIGIEPRDLGKVFEVFQRIHDKGAYPGTGLGLAIARKGAERMGGCVGVESQPGQGSRFWVELPQAAAAVDLAEQMF
jgi:signal transduction histidine kinase